jgi:hypothetical protein
LELTIPQATGTLLVDQPSGDSCAHSASVSPECVKASSWSFSTLLGGSDQDEREAKTGPLAPSRNKSEQDRHSRDFVLSYVRKNTLVAITNPAKTNPQYHFSAPDATLRYADLENDRNHEPLNLSSNTPLPAPPPSLNTPSTSPSPLDYDLELDSAYDKEKGDGITLVSKITAPTVSIVASHNHDSDHGIALLFDLEFEDYSDAFKVNQEVVPTPDPARGPQEEWVDTVDDKAAYIMGMTVGE